MADDGELLLTSDRLMTGYFELPVETSQALQDGWYHTGDLAEQDDEGYLYIVGRKKEVIRTGGETVAPVEVEAALAGYPGIAEVAIVGIPDPQWGEVVCAVVVLARGRRGSQCRGIAVPYRRASGGLQTPTPSCRSRRAPADLCDRARCSGRNWPSSSGPNRARRAATRNPSPRLAGYHHFGVSPRGFHCP